SQENDSGSVFSSQYAMESSPVIVGYAAASIYRLPNPSSCPLRMFPIWTNYMAELGSTRVRLRGRERAESRLCPEWPAQQRFDGRIDVEAAVQNGGDRCRDRHLDPAGVGHFAEHRGREHAFHQLAALRCFERAAFSERNPQGEIPRLPARAGQNEIAETGEAGEGLGPGAESPAET